MIGAAFTQPGRALPLYRPAASVFGPSPLDVATGAYRAARDACNYEHLLTAAYAALGRANRTCPENRKQARRTAFQGINAVRARQRVACAGRDAAEAALYRAGGLAADVDALDARPVVAVAFGGVSIHDDPDMAGAGWLS